MAQSSLAKQNTLQDELEAQIRAFLDGDQEAFRWLYEYSFSTVQAECFKVLHNNQDVDDCMQEAYIKIYSKLDTLSEPKKFLGWCRRIAHNTSVSFIDHRERKAGKDETRPPVGDEDYIGLDSLDDEVRENIPEQAAEMELVSELLTGALSSMPYDRAMVMMLYQQGYTFNEIAEQLAMPVGTAKSHVTYAKRQIHLEIERIEKQEGIKLHGYTIAPAAAGGFLVKAVPEENTGGTGWIGTESSFPSGTKHQNKLWKDLTKEVPALADTAVNIGIGKQILRVIVILIAATVIISGIIYAVDNIRDNTDENKTTVTTTVVSSTGSGNATVSGTNTANDTGAPNRSNAQGPAENNEPQQTAPETTAPPTNPSRSYVSVVANNPQNAF